MTSNHVTKTTKGNIISYSLTDEILEWLELHTGEPTVVGEFPNTFVNRKSGWKWGGTIYKQYGGFIEFEPHRANTAMLFKLTWGGQ